MFNIMKNGSFFAFLQYIWGQLVWRFIRESKRDGSSIATADHISDARNIIYQMKNIRRNGCYLSVDPHPQYTASIQQCSCSYIDLNEMNTKKKNNLMKQKRCLNVYKIDRKDSLCSRWLSSSHLKKTHPRSKPKHKRNEDKKNTFTYSCMYTVHSTQYTQVHIVHTVHTEIYKYHNEILRTNNIINTFEIRLWAFRGYYVDCT